MCRVFLYSRVSTDQQTLAQQERTVYEWLNAHQMKVDRVVSDEGVSGGVSYADRKLGKELLPMTVEGDMIIVSEISRLGRSMFDLSKLIHTELKPRKLRLVVVSMGIDLNCAKMTAIDELILNNFSFAAQLEKQLISERTLSALAVKKKQGVKLGAASETYRNNFNKKTKEEKKDCYMKRGQMKNERYLQRKDVIAFMKVLKSVFPEACSPENPSDWDWKEINTKGDNKDRLVSTITDYSSFDESGLLFKKWKFDDWDAKKTQVNLSSAIKNLRASVFLQKKNATITEASV